MPRTSNPEQARRQHARAIETAVNKFSPTLWAVARRLAAAWLRRALAAARDPIERLTLERRLWTEEKTALAELLASILGEAPPEQLLSELGRTFTEAFAQDVIASSGFLTVDPRLDELIASTEAILRDNLSKFWQSLTDPELLATRLVNLKAQGLSYVEMSNQISRQYGTEFYRAERLVRSSYNTGANAAHHRDMVDSGFETKTWLTSRDARVRRPQPGNPFDHASADGQTVAIDQPFIVSGERLMFPGDRSMGASAGNIINCRCTTLSS